MHRTMYVCIRSRIHIYTRTASSISGQMNLYGLLRTMAFNIVVNLWQLSKSTLYCPSRSLLTHNKRNLNLCSYNWLSVYGYNKCIINCGIFCTCFMFVQWKPPKRNQPNDPDELNWICVCFIRGCVLIVKPKP